MIAKPPPCVHDVAAHQVQYRNDLHVKLLVFEFVTGGGFAGETIPPSLAREGESMRNALVRELQQLPELHLSIMNDPRFPHPRGVKLAGIVERADSMWSVYESALRDVDCVWPIAPETDELMERAVQMARDRGLAVVASDAETLALAGSKIRTVRALERAGVDVVPTYLPHETPKAARSRWVVKPDDGCGCDGIRTFATLQEAQAFASTQSNAVLQPWIAGDAMSLSLICWPGSVDVLSVNRQRVEERDGALALTALHVGVMDSTEHVPLASAITRAMPGLRGYIGVDFIQTASGPVVLEINPRLTTSYCALNHVLGVNVAANVMSRLGVVDRAFLPAVHRNETTMELT